MLGMAGDVGTGFGGLGIYRILETTRIGKVGLRFRAKGFVSIVTKGDHLDSHKKRMFSGLLGGSGKFAHPSVLITFKSIKRSMVLASCPVSLGLCSSVS